MSKYIPAPWEPIPAMTDLPDREWLRRPAETGDFVDYMNELAKLAVAYCDGELKSRDEMNEEAATEALSRLYAANSRADTVTAVLDAAWEVDDE